MQEALKILKIFAAFAIFISANFQFAKVDAAKLNFQELRSGIAMPVLPERIRYRNSRRGPTKVIVNPKTIPKFRQQDKDNDKPTYVQRQPKKPPVIYVPRRPVAYPGMRGSYPHKNFGPPRARYVH